MRRLLIVVVLALVAAGCPGDEDEATSGGDSSGGGETTQVAGGSASAVTAPATAGFGCPDDQPTRLQLDQPYASLVTACVAEDRTTIHLENVSPAVLRVRPVSGGILNLTWEKPEDEREKESLAGDASVLAVNRYAAQLPLPRGQLLMPPGWSVVATLMAQTSLDLRVEREPTVMVLAAKATVNWIEGKVKTRNQQLAKSVTECAESAAKLYLAGRAQSWEDALRIVFFNSSPCFEVRKQVVALSEPPAGAADDAVRVADDLGRSARRVSTPGARLALNARNVAVKLLRAFP